MGNDTSKEIREIAHILEDDTVFGTPVNKLSHPNISMDPRSPTEGITRTPIEIIKGISSNGDVNQLRRRWKSEPDISLGEKEVSLKSDLFIQMEDPRSPSLGIIRTPIQVLRDKKENDKDILNEYDCKYELQVAHTNCVSSQVVEDCRSPSLGISRTPIEILAKSSKTSEGGLNIGCNENINITSLTPWHTPLSKKYPAPFVYTDDESEESKTGMNSNVIDFVGANEKENEINLKRKLVFTPESTKTGIKVRTPLGSRCNFQDSPSQYLKIMQVQKLGQEVGIGIEGSAHVATKTTKRKHPVMEWDKDSTVIM